MKKHEKSDFEGDHFMSRESIEIELMKILDNLERDYKEDDSEPFYNYAWTNFPFFMIENNIFKAWIKV